MTEPLSTRLSARSETSVRFPSGYHTGGAFKHVRVCGGSSAQSAPDGHVTGGADEVGGRAGLRAMVRYRTKRLPRCRRSLYA